MKHLTTTILSVVLFSLSCMLFAVNPEIQQAIELWENGQEAEAFPMFLKYKDSDDADALAYLGRSYFSGSGIEQDYAKAFEYFSKAAELGQPYGLNGMGVLYRNGDGVKQDLQLAEKYLLQASEAGCPLAEFNLGVLYEGVYYDLAKGVPSIPDFGNVTKALEHYRASYDAGNLKSQCAMDIGELLLKGETPADAIPWLQEAAANDQWRALARLAVMYDGGELVPIDNNLAIDYAERLGNVTDLWNLYAENCYRMGLEYLCKNQSREALMFLQEAADKGNADAQYYLSWIHPDEASRGKYAWMAVQNGNRLVLVQAGTYLAGQKQYDEAMKCYQEAAKDGDLQAMCEIAIMHRLGEGVPIDYEKSMEWYAKAAEQYYPRALRELGVKYLIQYDEDPKKEFYAEIPATLSKAYAYMAQAVLYNDDIAYDKLAVFPFIEDLPTMVPANSDMELAKGLVSLFHAQEDNLAEPLKFLEASAEHGNVDAMNALGYLYSLPNAPFVNMEASTKYYQMAAAKGSDYAARQLCGAGYGELLGEEKRLEILKAQAEKGFGVALHNLADYYDAHGDVQRAGELHLKNARNGDDHSVLRLSDYQYKAQQLPCDAEEIDRLLAESAARHYGEAEAVFAVRRWMTKDSRTAAIYRMRAYLDGLRLSALYDDLGTQFLFGDGVRRDVDFGIQLFEEGIRKGNWDLCLMLGSLLSRDSILGDKARAMEIYRLGAEHGVEGCQEGLEAVQAEIQKEQQKQGE